MKLTSKAAFYTALFALGSAASNAAVTLAFNSGTEGFIASSAASVSNSGGKLLVTGAPGGGGFSDAASRATSLSYGSATSLGTEFAAIAAAGNGVKGGTISFDVSFNRDDFTGSPSGILEFQLTLEGSSFGRDTEVSLISLPTAGNSATRTVTFDIFNSIAPGDGGDGNGTNARINLRSNAAGAGNGVMYFGFKGSGFTTTNFTIDNIVVTAVPEPTSALLLGSAGLLGLLRRRRA